MGKEGPRGSKEQLVAVGRSKRASLSSVSFIPAENREPERQEEGEKGRIHLLSCLLALNLLESNSLTSPCSPTNQSMQLLPLPQSPSSLLKPWWPVLGEGPASTLRWRSRQYDPRLKP